MSGFCLFMTPDEQEAFNRDVKNDFDDDDDYVLKITLN